MLSCRFKNCSGTFKVNNLTTTDHEHRQDKQICNFIIKNMSYIDLQKISLPTRGPRKQNIKFAWPLFVLLMTVCMIYCMVDCKASRQPWVMWIECMSLMCREYSTHQVLQCDIHYCQWHYVYVHLDVYWNCCSV